LELDTLSPLGGYGSNNRAEQRNARGDPSGSEDHTGLRGLLGDYGRGLHPTKRTR